jgi:penicillin-insensitive murein endopeptidase
MRIARRLASALGLLLALTSTSALAAPPRASRATPEREAKAALPGPADVGVRAAKSPKKTETKASAAPGKARATSRANAPQAKLRTPEHRERAKTRVASDVVRAVDAAPPKKGKRNKGATRPAVFEQKPKHELPKRSESVGHPNEGKLVGGIRVDTSLPYVRAMPNAAKGDVLWGLPSLVLAVEEAARTVAKKHPGAVLAVGDLSRKTGGEVDRHNSHESGRDVDLGFYLTDKKGKPAHPKEFVKVDETLAAGAKGVHFDVEKNWLLVQSLLADRKARVSHIFVASPLRHALLAYARPRVSRALLTRAQLVLMQPTEAAAHDDHMHVRVSCPKSADCEEYAKGAPMGGKKAKSDKALRLPKPARAAHGAHEKASRDAKSKPTSEPTSAPKAAAKAKPEPRRDDRVSVAPKVPQPLVVSPTSANPRRRGMVVSAHAKVTPAAPAPRLAPLWKGLSDVAGRLEAEADGLEVRDLLDEAGLLRITD